MSNRRDGAGGHRRVPSRPAARLGTDHRGQPRLGLEFDETGEPVAFRRCIDLAAGRALPLNAHHAHIHTGAAGEALSTKAGNFTVPGAPLTPWNNCAELIADFFGD